MTLDARGFAGIELGPLSLDALAKVHAGLDTLTKQLVQIKADEAAYQRHGPVSVPLVASGVVDSNSDPVYLDLGGPAYGRVWEVRQLVVGGITWATTVAGTAPVLVQANAPNAQSGVSLLNVQDCATALPAVAFYSSGQFRVRHPNHIWVVILSGTASTPYGAAGDAFDMPDGATAEVFAE